MFNIRSAAVATSLLNYHCAAKGLHGAQQCRWALKCPYIHQPALFFGSGSIQPAKKRAAIVQPADDTAIQHASAIHKSQLQKIARSMLTFKRICILLFNCLMASQLIKWVLFFHESDGERPKTTVKGN